MAQMIRVNRIFSWAASCLAENQVRLELETFDHLIIGSCLISGLPEMSSGTKIITAVTWSFVSRSSSQLLQFAFLVVLARLVDPSEFGSIGMLVVFTGFGQAVGSGGLNAALIHFRTTTEIQYSTAFWLQLALGVILSTLLFFVAPLIAEFYSVPVLEPLARLVSSIILIQAVGSVQSALLIMELEFRTLSMINIVATILSGIVAISLALNGYGVWALAWQSLVLTGATTGLLWTQSKWRPRLVFDSQVAGRLVRYGIYLFGFESFNYGARNLDNLLIGKFLGAHELGIYSRAYQLMMLPISNIASVIGNVMFPALAELQDDLPRFKRLYLKATCLIAVITFPLMAGMAVLCEPFILAIFGSKWIEVIPVLKIFSLVGLFESIVHPIGWIFNSLGKTKMQFKLLSLFVPILIFAFGVGLHFGILGVAIAYALWSLFGGLISLHIGGKYIDLSLSNILLGVAPIGIVTAIMAVIVIGVDLNVLAVWSPGVRLVAGVLLGVGSYLALCLLTKNQTFAELIRLVSKVMAGRVAWRGRARPAG